MLPLSPIASGGAPRRPVTGIIQVDDKKWYKKKEWNNNNNWNNNNWKYRKRSHNRHSDGSHYLSLPLIIGGGLDGQPILWQ